jgi:hypothetical protein
VRRIYGAIAVLALLCRAALVKISAVSEARKADIDEQCPGVKPGAGRILLCVKQRFAALTDACKDAIG